MWLLFTAMLLAQQTPDMPVLSLCSAEVVEVCREPATIAPSEAERRLGSSDLAFWQDGQDFNVLARRPDRPQLCCTIQSTLEPVTGSSNLWTLTARIRDLDQALLDVWLLPHASR